MKNIIISTVALFFITCNKDAKISNSEYNNSTYDFSKDSCRYSLLKGIYISNSNTNDTIIIDSNISAYVNGAKPHSGNYVDIFTFCATKDTLTLNRWGWTKPLTPTVKVGYSISNNNLNISRIVFTNINFNCDTFFASISNKTFTKVK